MTTTRTSKSAEEIIDIIVERVSAELRTAEGLGAGPVRRGYINRANAVRSVLEAIGGTALERLAFCTECYRHTCPGCPTPASA